MVIGLVMWVDHIMHSSEYSSNMDSAKDFRLLVDSRS